MRTEQCHATGAQAEGRRSPRERHGSHSDPVDVRVGWPGDSEPVLLTHQQVDRVLVVTR